jgi:hypothetical protein
MDGCKFVVTGDDMASLLDVFASGQLRSVQPTALANPGNFETRTVVYLHQTNGTVVDIIMSREFRTAVIEGRYNGNMFVAKMGLGKDLYNWRAQHTPVNPSALMCQQDPIKY